MHVHTCLGRLDQEKTREEYKQYNESLGRKVDLFDKGLDDRLQRAVVNAFNNALTQLSGSQIYDPLSGGRKLLPLVDLFWELSLTFSLDSPTRGSSSYDDWAT